MSYISIYVSSTDSNISFSSLIQGKNTLKTLRNNSVTQVGVVTSLKCETLKFIKCFQVHSLMSCSQASWRVGLGLLPLIYLAGKRVWEESVICPTLHNESWNHLLVQMLPSPRLSYLICHCHKLSSSNSVSPPQLWSTYVTWARSPFSRWHKRKGESSLIRGLLVGGRWRLSSFWLWK